MLDVNKFTNKNEVHNIDKDNSGVRIGQRIKTIREARGMTRAELGMLVGLDQNRIQQYENGRRNPKLPLLKKIAEALGVNIIALMEPTFEDHICTMHALFQTEEKLDVRVVEKDGCYCLQFGDGRTGDMNSYLREWYEARKALEETMSNLINEECRKKILEYNMFEWNFPGKSKEKETTE